MHVRFEWDDTKARVNSKKHGLSFDEARELFLSATDYIEDADFRFGEIRFRRIGPISNGVVVVVYVERRRNTIRVISARYATANEIERFRSEVMP